MKCYFHHSSLVLRGIVLWQKNTFVSFWRDSSYAYHKISAVSGTAHVTNPSMRSLTFPEIGTSSDFSDINN
jgi:hypothetical protein